MRLPLAPTLRTCYTAARAAGALPRWAKQSGVVCCAQARPQRKGLGAQLRPRGAPAGVRVKPAPAEAQHRPAGPREEQVACHGPAHGDEASELVGGGGDERELQEGVLRR